MQISIRPRCVMTSRGAEVIVSVIQWTNLSFDKLKAAPLHLSLKHTNNWSVACQPLVAATGCLSALTEQRAVFRVKRVQSRNQNGPVDIVWTRDFREECRVRPYRHSWVQWPHCRHSRLTESVCRLLTLVGEALVTRNTVFIESQLMPVSPSGS